MIVAVCRLAPPDATPLAGPLFELVARFATSFVPVRETFETSLRTVLADGSAWLGVAEVTGAPSESPGTDQRSAGSGGVARSALAGYCLGFDHPAFYANGGVAWVEEIMVREDLRGQGVGRALMDAFEMWASDRGDRLVGLATRRAAAFYDALGYETSAAYFRKLL